ncbi:MAG: MiaB/RimO family radical SAM methylthiotransferase [Candidatus Omnitrophica bacterium]|nr:MiaB/RimO family radical SAM methylthiotransferase [Candidatus Omnitrophota bacterium]
MKARIGVLSLGCPRNLVDSEVLLNRLNLKGYDIVDIDKADVVLVNTCAFIDDAKKESIDAILDLAALKKEGKLKKIIVYGCLAQRYKDKLSKELPEIDAFVGRIALDKTPERFAITSKHYAYLKICEGCLNLCSYCIIPKIKGKFSSLSADAILNKTAEFNKNRISELNIIGQDISGYGFDLGDKEGLKGLLSKIVKKADNIHWIRLLYLNPSRISDDLLKLIRDESKICKYIDLPIQHINERILKLMNRNTSKKEIINTINRVRKIIPQVALRTAVIAGFPSETDSEFKELLNFIKQTEFERLGAFSYSREEGTVAYSLKNQLSEKTKRERLDLIMSTQQEVSTQVNSRLLGKVLEVLIDEEDNGKYLGRSEYDAPEVDGSIFINKPKKKIKVGDFVKAKIVDTLEYDLVGEVES